VGTNTVGGRGVGQVGFVVFVQSPGRHRQRAVDAVAAAVGAYDVAVAALGGGAHQGAAL
jgi:hypothetical protein